MPHPALFWPGRVSAKRMQMRVEQDEAEHETPRRRHRERERREREQGGRCHSEAAAALKAT